MVSPSWTSVVCPIAENLAFPYGAQAPEFPRGPARVSVCFRGRSFLLFAAAQIFRTEGPANGLGAI